MKKLSVVIPVYNSEKTIEEVVSRINAAVKTFGKIEKYEIILVNDGSVDNSYAVCKKMSENAKYIKFIQLAKNFGQLRAIMAGFSIATGEYIVCLDDDLQNPPEEISKLIYTLEDGNYDIVFSKYEEKKHSKFRNFGSYLSDLMATKLMDKPKDLYVSSFFIMRRFIVDEIIKYDNPYPYFTGLFFRTTKNVGTVLVKHNLRKVGSSGYTLKKLVGLMVNGFTNFSVKPLRLSTILGLILSGLSFIFAIGIVIRKLMTPSVSVGWTSIMVAIIFFGGIQLLSIGLLGEYIGRIYMCINKTPQYVIREKFNIERDIYEENK